MFAIGLVLGAFDFKWDVTLGDIALGVVAFLFTVAISGYKYRVNRHPFTMLFYEKPYDTQDENPGADWKIIQCEKDKERKFFIGVQLRIERTFQTIDVRLVEKNWLSFLTWDFFWVEPPKGTAIVSHVRDQQFLWRGRDKDNRKGGREAEYEQSIQWPVGGFMWYEVTVKADKDWNGWLGFQLRRGSSHKGTVHAKLCFQVKP